MAVDPHAYRRAVRVLKVLVVMMMVCGVVGTPLFVLVAAAGNPAAWVVAAMCAVCVPLAARDVWRWATGRPLL